MPPQEEKEEEEEEEDGGDVDNDGDINNLYSIHAWAEASAGGLSAAAALGTATVAGAPPPKNVEWGIYEYVDCKKGPNFFKLTTW